MNDEQMDRALEQTPDLPVQLAEKIRAHILSDTKPVKPLMSSAAYALIFAGIAFVVAIAFATGLKWKGLHALPAGAAAQLLLALVFATFLSAGMAARSMRPAAGPLHSWLLGGLTLLIYEGLVIRVFNDYRMDAFVHRGILCLSLGVLCGVIAATPLWLIARCGFIVQPVRAGAAIGMAGGLSGLAFLTLHCDILTVPHTSLWHAAVIVVCVLAGAAAGKLSR